MGLKSTEVATCVYTYILNMLYNYESNVYIMYGNLTHDVNN